MKAGLYPVLGPPASGKTSLALDWALEVLKGRGRVLWVGLPHQRAYVYRLLAARGAFLGLEFLSLQALYYRVLAEAGWLRPLLPGAGRVALVGEALRELMGPEVSPGEARLFARAIAELKRFGLSPFALPKEGEAGRLRRVYFAYERLKRGSLDYDDFRYQALKAPLRLFPEPHLVLVDGFREVGPLDLRFFRRLAARVPVLLTLEVLPEGLTPWRELPPRPLRREVWRFANLVEESRHLLKALKRALAPKALGGEGLRPEEVFVVAPEDRIGGLLLLKEEYGLPLEDGRERSLVETEEGERVLSLLNPFPSGRDLLALGFPALGRRALRLGLAGEEALGLLAEREGLLEEWRAFLALRTPGEDPLAWGEEVLERLGVSAKEPFLSRLRLALRVDRADPLPWWRSLLLDETLPPEVGKGIPVLPPLRATGVRARRVYVLEWVAGRYTLGEREDYFLLEELRERGLLKGLKRRLRGLDPLFQEEMASRGEEVYLLYPEAGPSGPLEPLAEGKRPEPLPPSSRLEALDPEPFQPPLPSGAKGFPGLEGLRRLLEECPLRVYLGRFPTLEEDGTPGWSLLAKDPLRLAQDPRVASWYEAHQEHLKEMRFFVPWEREHYRLYLDGVRWEGDTVHIYRLLPAEARPDLGPRKRWTEWKAIEELTQGRFKRKVEAVYLWFWPWLAEPSLYRTTPYRKGERPPALKEIDPLLQQALALWREGPFAPRPGNYCHTCHFQDICRKEEA